MEDIKFINCLALVRQAAIRTEENALLSCLAARCIQCYIFANSLRHQIPLSLFLFTSMPRRAFSRATRLSPRARYSALKPITIESQDANWILDPVYTLLRSALGC